MDRKQQNEALDYFRKFAGDWARQASVDSPDEVNVIRQRNDFVLKVIDGREETESALDVGCGTGALVCEMAGRGINAVGVDFSAEMIAIAKDKAKKECGRAEFECCSIFDFNCEPGKYDVISANGFIEYISHEELDRFLQLSRMALRDGGSLVLGSRNRLFNIFSLNKFTREEIEDGNIIALLLEAVKLVESENIVDAMGVKAAPLQKEDKKHENTGIKVSTRYQYTPVQLASILKNGGFETHEIAPVHIHGTPPKFNARFPAVHGRIANGLQTFAGDNFCLIPQASSFMIHARK